MYYKVILLLITAATIGGCQPTKNDHAIVTVEEATKISQTTSQDAIIIVNPPIQDTPVNYQSNTTGVATTVEQTTRHKTTLALPNKEISSQLPSKKGISSHKNTNQPPVVDLWQPNEAQIARGQDLLEDLREEINHSPSTSEMERRLQTYMGLSNTQAQKIIAALEIALEQS